MCVDELGMKRSAKGWKREMGLMRNERKGATLSEWSSGDLALRNSDLTLLALARSDDWVTEIYLIVNHAHFSV